MKSLFSPLLASLLLLCAVPAHAQLLYPESTMPSFQPGTLDQFGADIAISGSRLLTIAPARYTPLPGAAYVIDLQSGELLHQFDEYATQAEFNDQCIVLAYPGRYGDPTHIAVYDPNTYELINSIDFVFDSDYYVMSMALHDTHLVIGSSFSNAHANSGGQVLVFNALSGELEHELHPDQYFEQGYFGNSVAIDHNRIVVTTGSGSIGENDKSGLFLYDANTGDLEHVYHPQTIDNKFSTIWAADLDGDTLAYQFGISGVNSYDYEVRVVDLSDPETNFEGVEIHAPQRNYTTLYFGNTVRLLGDYLIVLARAEPEPHSGTALAYVYDRDSLQLISTLRNNPSDRSQSFFMPNTLVGNSLYMGIVNNGVEGAVGEGHVSQFTLSRCPQDLDHDGALTATDVLSFAAQRPDWNDNGRFDFFDVSSYIEQFLAGCP